MMKIIKSFLIVLVVLGTLSININSVSAANSTISVKSSSKTIIEGSTFKVTITVSSSKSLGSWEFDVKYDTNKLSLVSSTLEGKTNSVGYVQSSGTKTKTYTMTFKAKSSGSAKIEVKNSLVWGWDENSMSSSNGSVTVNIISQKELEASYSKDNYLSSLSVSGYDINPKFDKKTTEYSLELENDVREIKVSDKANDSKADVDGTGKHKLDEGENKITIRVTAENGNARNYVIKVLVKELNPIDVEVDGKHYTVVRKSEDLEPPSTFKTTTTMIAGEEVPAFESEFTGYLLVALKDEDANVKYFIYKDNDYTLYEEMVFNGTTLYMIKPDVIPEGYTLSNISINGINTDVYKIEEYNYPLVYGVNVQTGKKNWYTYEEKEMTLQIFDNDNIKVVEVDDTKYIITIISLASISTLLLLFVAILSYKARKNSIKKIA